ncbi:MAG: RpiB/LacA/LacB family sugar-phosphate isomerase [Candidatus Nanohaloarchaea archaeon]|nr:RpiB/LacA/LacB family sugar-phosphate isomerase [Candidatus Nanohaloarchaea archaeon]
MILGLFADHAGHDVKEAVYEQLEQRDGVEVRNFSGYEEGDDYPDVVDDACQRYEAGECDAVIVICGTGIGVSMAANRRGVRVGRVCSPEDAELAKRHNDAEGLAFGGRQMDADRIVECIDAYLSAEFEGGRHERRVNKI